MKRQRGFSLIELLIVVAIILIIAAIAIPNLLRARMAANQSSAVGTLRTISSANVNYGATYGVGYSPTLAALGGPINANANCGNAQMIDPVISTGANPQKSGYQLNYVGANAWTGPLPAGCAAGWSNFTAQNTPVTVGQTGQTSYCIDDSGVQRFNPAGVLIAAPCNTSGFPALQ